MTVDVSAAALVPRRVGTAAEAFEVSRVEGAAILSGIPDEDSAVDVAREVVGDRLLRLGKQFDAVKDIQDALARRFATSEPDEKGRRRIVGLDSEEPQQPHNDGYAFGDFASDRMFLHCERPSDTGGESFLVDGARLLEILADHGETRALAEFAWTVPVDHSEPGHPQNNDVPLARRLENGRVQIRHHVTIAPVSQADPAAEKRDAEMIALWSSYVHQVRDTGRTFTAAAGEVICIDNYRVMHGRLGYSDPHRKMHSIWAWTTDAIAVPSAALSIDDPDLAALSR
jgi:gamma-butyrobetaine dioxygenase